MDDDEVDTRQDGARPPLRLEPPKRRVDPIALRAYREGRVAAGQHASNRARGRRRAGVGAVVVVAALALASIVFALVLPGCLRRKAIATAAAHGVALTIESVRVSTGRFVLVGVTATSTELPQLTMRAAEVEVDLSGIDVDRVVARNGEIAATGPYEAVTAALDKWKARHAGAAAGSPADGWGLESMHLAWDAPAAGVARLDALELRVDLVPREDALHVSSPHVTLETARGAFGPWRFNFDRERRAARVRVGFDPLLGDGPSLLVIADDARVTQVKLGVARGPLSALGVPAAALGLSGVAGESTHVEADAEYVWLAPGRATVKATLGLYALRLTRAAALDATIDVEGAGDPAAGIALKRGALTVGPLQGTVTGSVRVEGGARADLAFATNAVPCSAFLLAPSPPSPGGASPAKLNEIADQLKRLAHALGLAKITGTYKAEGALTLDATDLAKTTATFTPQSTCEAELFGP